MKRFPIFRTGKHTATSGATLDFSDAQLRAAVAAYDPKLHEAPITVGHPKDNLPAYGWIAGLHFNEGTGEIEADPAQVDADFADMVQAGRFKKRSASWYLPDAPNNPKPGTLYLRHLAFLGAQPPAVKGLRDVSFSDAEQGVVEFGDSSRWAWSSLAGIMRGMREWIIGKDGLETADKLVPNYLLTDLEAAAKATDEETTPAAMPAFAEEDPMKIEELQAQVAALSAQVETLKANQKPADFAEREAAVLAGEQRLARAAVEARIEALVAAGKMLPAQKKAAVDFACSLADKDATLDFGEGDAAKKVTQREAYLLNVEAGPVLVDYSERSGPGVGGGGGELPTIADVQRSLTDQVAAGGRAAAKA